MRGSVIVYPPEGADPRYQVWFGDGVHPGRELASCVSVDEANRTCVLLAMSMRVLALPLDEGWDWRIRGVVPGPASPPIGKASPETQTK